MVEGRSKVAGAGSGLVNLLLPVILNGGGGQNDCDQADANYWQKRHLGYKLSR